MGMRSPTASQDFLKPKHIRHTSMGSMLSGLVSPTSGKNASMTTNMPGDSAAFENNELIIFDSGPSKGSSLKGSKTL